jgi:hypothetical protein
MMTPSPPSENASAPLPPAEGEANARPRHRGRWVIVLLLAFFAISAFAAWFTLRVVGYSMNGFQPPEMAAAQFSPRDVVGDLGGMPVTIPRHFANYVEYDGDPGFGEKRKGPAPERTQQSKLKSFGYDVRLPDMAGMSSAEIWKDRQRFTVFDTPWISVGVSTGQSYPGDGFLDRRTAALSRPPVLDYDRYEELPQTEYGLTVYAPAGIDPKTGRPYREDRNARDVFIHRGKDGKVNAYISCSNVPHEAAPCQHSFSLEPEVRARISVIYRRGYLSQWREIQSAVTDQLLSFRTKDANPSTVNR